MNLKIGNKYELTKMFKNFEKGDVFEYDYTCGSYSMDRVGTMWGSIAEDYDDIEFKDYFKPHEPIESQKIEVKQFPKPRENVKVTIS